MTIKIQAGIFCTSRQGGFENIHKERERNKYSQDNFEEQIWNEPT